MNSVSHQRTILYITRYSHLYYALAGWLHRVDKAKGPNEMIITFMNVSVNCRNGADISITICVTVGPH